MQEKWCLWSEQELQSGVEPPIKDLRKGEPLCMGTQMAGPKVSLGVLVEDWGLLVVSLSRYCLLYTSVPLLEKELDDFVFFWNSHLIRKNKLSQSPSGVPNEMHELPALYGKLSTSYLACLIPPTPLQVHLTS